MTEMQLRQSEFTYSACGLFTENKERRKKFKKTWDSRYIYQNKLDKTWFQYDMICRGSKDLNRRTAADKALYLILLKIQNMMDINVDLPQWSINSFDKRTTGGTVKNEIISNKGI